MIYEDADFHSLLQMKNTEIKIHGQGKIKRDEKP
jgi:hypothetical protein